VVAGVAQLLSGLGAARIATVLPDSGAYHLSKYF
jgi:hypothetical protein